MKGAPGYLGRRSSPSRRDPSVEEAASGSEAGDTLVEVMLALMVMSICGVALLSAFATSITASSRHRTLANMNTILASYAETATSQIQQQQSFAACATPSTYNGTVVPPPLPSGVYGISVTSVTYWNGTSFTSTCATSLTPQLVVATATGPSGITGTISFVVSEYGYTPPGSTLRITTASLASATKGAAYSQTLVATGGTGTLTWSITGGSLPTGLSLTSSTGKISGTVSAAATTQTFTVAVTDADGASYATSLKITVN